MQFSWVVFYLYSELCKEKLWGFLVFLDYWYFRIYDHITYLMETEKLKNINEFEDKSLLIVDDDNPFRERLARAMEKKGFKVSQAEGVKKGLDAVRNNKPAFAVVD